MAEKRRFDQAGDHTAAAPHKKRKFGNDSKKSKSDQNHESFQERETTSLNQLRSRIRSLRRLLAHDDAIDDQINRRKFPPKDTSTPLHTKDELEIADKHERRDEKRLKRLPANIRIEHERELQSLEHEVETTEAKRRRGKMIAKWHMVRFFERRRAERVLKRARKALKAAEDEGSGDAEGVALEEGSGVEGLRTKVRRAEIALNYALYYPLDKAYVSLWPKGKGEAKDGDYPGKGQDTNPQGDPAMWAMVEKCMAEDRLEDLKEGRLGGGNEKQQPQQVRKGTKDDGKVSKRKKEIPKKPPLEGTTGGDESDGGFFDEA